jgi:hypothetical protein
LNSEKYQVDNHQLLNYSGSQEKKTFKCTPPFYNFPTFQKVRLFKILFFFKVQTEQNSARSNISTTRSFARLPLSQKSLAESEYLNSDDTESIVAAVQTPKIEKSNLVRTITEVFKKIFKQPLSPMVDKRKTSTTEKIQDEKEKPSNLSNLDSDFDIYGREKDLKRDSTEFDLYGEEVVEVLDTVEEDCVKVMKKRSSSKNDIFLLM